MIVRLMIAKLVGMPDLAISFIVRLQFNLIYLRSPAFTPSSHRPQPDQTRRSLVPSLNAQSTNSPAVGPSDADLYTHNSLQSFSFGSVQSQPSSRSLNPLSPLQADADSASDEFSFPSDITPRPSVVAYQPTDNPSRSHPTQPPGQSGWPPPSQTLTVDHPRVRVETDRNRDHGSGGDSDTSSRLTLGSSSASASVTSLSSNSVGLSRNGSRASRRTDTTTQTSANDLSSTDDEEDHHHPIPPHLNRELSGHAGTRTGTGNHAAVEFSSDEEYPDSDYDDEYEYYDEGTGMSIEIGSAQYEGSVVTHELERELYASSVRTFGGGSERRGSLPMTIPITAPPTDPRDDAFFQTGREREDSLATIRRPSRSLDDEFYPTGRGPDSANKRAGEVVSNIQPPPAPVSVPESDGDWRTLHERQLLKGKARQRESPISPTPTSGVNKTLHQPSYPLSPSNQGNAMDGFDLGWSALQGGITGFDRSNVADIIQTNNNADPNARRPSNVGSKWLPWGNNNARRPSTATVSSGYGDSFGKAIGRWGGEEYRAQRRDWSFRMEKTDRGAVHGAVANGESSGRSTTKFLTPRGSMTAERSGLASPADRERQRERPGFKDVDREKTPKPASVWRGMQLGSQEVWRNDLAGRFRVDRRANKRKSWSFLMWENFDSHYFFSLAADPSKGPQQRLVVTHIRDNPNTPYGGPPVTIHKHSKAIAFSISRHYRPRVPVASSSHQGNSVGVRSDSGTNSSSRATPNGDVVPAAKKSSSMILLAPRRVQEAFTSTNTTRKLESHGLLEDKTTEARDREKARRHKERERERGKEKQKEKERQRRIAEDSKNKGKSKAKDDNQVPTSNTGSVSSGVTTSLHLPPPPATAPALQTYSQISPSSFEPVIGRSPTNRSNSRTSSRRRRRAHDPLNDDSDDNDAPPARTPHSETYGTMDASVIEQIRPRHDRSLISDFDSGGFLKRFIRGRSAHAVAGPSSGQAEPYYDPPWIVLASRGKQEQQQRVVDNLNTSFKDVGLLPSTSKDKPKRSAPSQKQKKIANAGREKVDIFQEVPPESLYMLLPAWPGDTDPVSERNPDLTQRPHIPSEKRQYLLVYYKRMPEAATPKEHTKSRDEGEGKKRTRISPTSSSESTKRDDRTSILLPSFHISARLVSYKDLQGSGVRVPDEGLTVTGPLDVAFRTMPSSVRNEPLYDWVIGICHSRDAGIEFYPDGLIKMGLCLQTSEPVHRLRSEEDIPEEPDVELTPVGRAVLEMAWLGGMALTSFGPGT